MDILKDLQNMIDRSSAFAKRNEIELRGNGGILVMFTLYQK